MNNKRVIDVHFSSLSNEWATPQELFNRITEKYGPFTLDPCCTKETSKCTKFFTIAEDGLKQDWGGRRVFCNPPYGKVIGKWVEKSYQETFKGSIVVMLIPARTDTRWWHKYCMRAERIIFFKGRIKFIQAGKKAPAPFPSCLVIFSNKSVDGGPVFDTMDS
jgi:phage N-6-adenine-methyltransferase